MHHLVADGSKFLGALQSAARHILNIMKKNIPKIIAVVGPTASGKTSLGVKLAKEFKGEIVSADSRQIYRGLDLGTGKDLSEYDGIKYHLIDICDPRLRTGGASPYEEFNLFKYLELAGQAINDILSREKLPIIVGGTGLYVQALVEGFHLNQISPHFAEASRGKNSKFYTREQLSNLTLRLRSGQAIQQLQKILQELDIKAYESLADKKNPHRLIRAIERAQEGIVMTKKKPDWDVLQIGITWPKEELDTRIDKRVDERFEQGMLEETESSLKTGVSPDWLLKLGLEYRIMTSFLISNSKFLIPASPAGGSNQIPNPKSKFQKINSFNDMVKTLKLRSHQYAKRQMTWFKRFPEIVWENNYQKERDIVEEFLAK